MRQSARCNCGHRKNDHMMLEPHQCSIYNCTCEGYDTGEQHQIVIV